jgi:integrative and conjugative element protein (TIGR02256 family)
LQNWSQNRFNPSIASLEIRKDVVDFIRTTTLDCPDVETGGILMGRDEGPYKVHITHASLPGPNAIQTPTMFIRDTEYCREILRENYDLYGVDYVGEWHSHICNLRGMSMGDYATLSSIINDKDYNFNSFGIIVAVYDYAEKEVSLVGYLSSDRYVMRVEVTSV